MKRLSYIWVNARINYNFVLLIYDIYQCMAIDIDIAIIVLIENTDLKREYISMFVLNNFIFC